MFLSDLYKENNYCKMVSLNAGGLFFLLWTNLENISRIFVFADLDLPRNSAKIGRRENLSFYGSLKNTLRVYILKLFPFTLIMS